MTTQAKEVPGAGAQGAFGGPAGAHQKLLQWAEGVRTGAASSDPIVAIVAKLGQIDRKVIGARYLTEGSRYERSQRCGMREREFTNVLNRARGRISLAL